MKHRTLILAVFVIVILGSVGAIVYMLNSQNQAKPQSQSAADTRDAAGITLNEVQKHTGKDGNSCWVVVDDTVYEISGFVQWVDGVHTPSGGKARCGKDLSEVISESPHGKSKLKYLKEVGPFKR